VSNWSEVPKRHIVQSTRSEWPDVLLLIQHLHRARLSACALNWRTPINKPPIENNNRRGPYCLDVTEALSQRVFVTAGRCIGAAVAWSRRRRVASAVVVVLDFGRISHLIPWVT